MIGFIASFSEEERKTLVIVLATLARIDGIDEAETAYIENLAKKIGVEFNEEFFCFSHKQCTEQVAQIKNRRVALEIIKYMFILSYTDETFSDEEGVFICHISEALGVESEKVKEISQWVADRLIWIDKGIKIFNS